MATGEMVSVAGQALLWLRQPELATRSLSNPDFERL